MCIKKKSTLVEAKQAVGWDKWFNLVGVQAITQGLINLMKHKSTKISQGEEHNLGIMYY